MAIRRYLQAYGPQEIRILKAAFEEALHLAGISDRMSWESERIAESIIGAFKKGERDPSLIARLVAGRTIDPVRASASLH